MKMPKNIAVVLAKQMGTITSQDISALGISRTMLGRYVSAGLLERVGRGLYTGVDDCSLTIPRFLRLRRDHENCWGGKSLTRLSLTRRWRFDAMHHRRIAVSFILRLCRLNRHETAHRAVEEIHERIRICYNIGMKGNLLYSDEVYAIQGAVFAVYKEMGNAWSEEVYHQCLEKELTLRGIPFDTKKALRIY